MTDGRPGSGPGTSSGRVVLRPRRARVVVYVCAAAVLITMLWLAAILPSPEWGIGSRAGVVAFGVGAVWLLHRLADVRVVADDSGVVVVNVVTTRRLAWAEVVGVRLLRDDPWMMLDLAEGRALAAMGVQHSEGERGQVQARRFARLVQEHTRVPGHD